MFDQRWRRQQTWIWNREPGQRPLFNHFKPHYQGDQLQLLQRILPVGANSFKLSTCWEHHPARLQLERLVASWRPINPPASQYFPAYGERAAKAPKILWDFEADHVDAVDKTPGQLWHRRQEHQKSQWHHHYQRESTILQSWGDQRINEQWEHWWHPSPLNVRSEWRMKCDK